MPPVSPYGRAVRRPWHALPSPLRRNPAPRLRSDAIRAGRLPGIQDGTSGDCTPARA
jgi:hypothetical protein